MKQPSSLILITLVLFSCGAAAAQSPESNGMTRPRTVTGSKTTKSSTARFQHPDQTQAPSRPAEAVVKTNNQQPDEPKTGARDESPRHLSLNRLRSRINEAARLMKARPVPTAMTVPSLAYVQV